MTADQIQRYARHLPLFGQAGQQRLRQARILCVGAGGLGAPILQYLTAAGIGTLGIVDGDDVALSNLQRQVIFNEHDIGKNKATQAAAHLVALNNELNPLVYPLFLNQDNAFAIAENFDVIIDATDNYRARYLLNDVAVKFNTPLISASIYQYQGQCSVFNYQNGPCYRCLYEMPPSAESMPNCALGGVLGVLPGVLGTIQATEAIKIILNQGKSLAGRLLIFDALTMATRELQIPKNKDCPCCQLGQSASHLFSDTPAPSVPTINAPDLADLLNRTPHEFILLDVREAYERDICHLGGQHLPLNQLSSQLSKLPKNQRIICYCKAGARSNRAAQILLAHGFTDVCSLHGGVLAWIAQIDPSLSVY